jgi:2-oxoglutarate ferredoxin oxidoreductase subunit gamma
MSSHELIIAGFGGQGVLFLGEVLARAGMRENRQVTWLPSYGPEQRGGTANCTVVVSDEPIGSPVVADPSILIVLNRPSLDRFEPLVRPGGLILYDSTMVTRAPVRTDVTAVGVPATAIARDLGSARAANVVLLGVLLAIRAVVAASTARTILDEMVADPAAKACNAAALERGSRHVGAPALAV